MKTRIFVDDGYPEAREYANNYYDVAPDVAMARHQELLALRRSQREARRRRWPAVRILNFWRHCSARVLASRVS